MKGNKHGFRRVLAVLLSAMLMVSNLGLTAFADGSFVTGNDGILSPFDGENVSVHRVDNILENAKIHSPIMSGIKGNLGKYIVRGAKAVTYIIRAQRRAK